MRCQRRGPGCKEERRKEAIERNAKWQALTRDQKIASLKARRGLSKRQFSRLMKEERNG
jgi:hypothetical protein